MNILNKLSETKYSTLYIKIIENAKQQNRIKLKKGNSNYIYYEAHHILPVALFPDFESFKYNPWNKVLLTPREHFISHLLIWKHYKKLNNMPYERKMSKAIHRMNKSGQYNSKLYENYKLNLKDSEETKLKKSLSHIGLFHSEETKLKMSETSKGILKSETHKINMRKPKSEEGRKNIAEAAKNRPPKSEETKDKMKLSKKLRDDKNYRVIELYDNNNIKQYICNINFKQFCSDNNLPFTSFNDSLKYNNKLYNNLVHAPTITRVKKLGYYKFKGWTAVVA